MAFGKKSNQEEIINIPLDNLDVDPENIKVMSEFYNTKQHKLKTYTLPVIELVVLVLLIAGLIYACLNYRFVEGDVVGKEFSIGGISVVSNSYEPADYINEGKLVYYNGKDTFVPIDLKGSFDVGVVNQVQGTRIFIPGQSSIKDTVISIDDVDYVIEREASDES